MAGNQRNERSDSQKPTLGFIGLGQMGSRMASRLLEAGYPVTVYNRTKERTRALVELGATAAETPARLAAECDVVLTMVTDDAAQEHVLYGVDGVLAGVRDGSIVVDFSTVSPDASRRLYEAARDKGAMAIDAPVSGSLPQAEQGILVIFVGGDEEVYQQCRPILAVLGKSSFYMGPSGMGTTMKLVVNALLGLAMQGLAEAVAVGEKAGLPKETLLDVLEQTAVVTPAQKAKFANIRRDEYPKQFALSLMHKDLGLVLGLAGQVSAPMPATAVTRQMYTAAMAQGMTEDFSILVRFIQQLAGVSSP